MKADAIKLGGILCFITNQQIEAKDYYIYWTIFKKDYKLAQSKHGEYPKSPHGKIVASTEPKLGLPLISQKIVKLIEDTGVTQVELKEVEVPVMSYGMSDGGKPETEKILLVIKNEVVAELFTNEMVEDCIQTAVEMDALTPQEVTKLENNNMGVKIKINAEEVLIAKFKDTFAVIEGYYKEAKGDVQVSQTYSANAVYTRMSKIREIFLEDIKKTAKDLEV